MKTSLFKNARILDFDHPKGLSRPHDILVQDGKPEEITGFPVLNIYGDFSISRSQE